jgi:hypothetical protein
MEARITIPVLIFIIFFGQYVSAQNMTDEKAVSEACMNYIEGFYEGDEAKLKASLSPDLHKFGFWKDPNSGEFSDPRYMTYDQALEFARNVKKEKNFAASDAPRLVKVLDIKDYIAAAKVTAWWGEDYILLSRRSGKWMIEQVIWEGPLTN